MSPSAFLLGVFVTWAVIGVGSAIVMGRRGHAPFSWLILGTVFGPLVIPLAVERQARARQLAAPVPDDTWRGPVDVLVGIDGSAEAVTAANVVARLLGDRIGRFTLATVVDYDTALDGEAGPAHRAARASVDRAASALTASLPVAPEAVVLTGKPAHALADRAADGRFDVLTVGSRGRGAAKPLLGSVASRLARGGVTPVLIVSDPEASAAGRRNLVSVGSGIPAGH